jgi:hypothetical protein
MFCIPEVIQVLLLNKHYIRNASPGTGITVSPGIPADFILVYPPVPENFVS